MKTLLLFFCYDFSFPPFLLSSKAPMIEQHALYRAKTKVNSLKLNNPLETHKNGNYFIGPLHLLLPSPHLGHSFFRNFLVYDRRLQPCEQTTRYRPLSSPSPFSLMSIPKTIQHGIESRDTHRKSAHTHWTQFVRKQTWQEGPTGVKIARSARSKARGR